jgi:hypothetical protein
MVAVEERYQRDAWIWRFTRRWITERNRAGIEEDDECRAFKAILAGENNAQAIPITGSSKGQHKSSSANLSGADTLSDSLLFPAEYSLNAAGGAMSKNASFASGHLPVR